MWLSLSKTINGGILMVNKGGTKSTKHCYYDCGYFEQRLDKEDMDFGIEFIKPRSYQVIRKRHRVV
jgi:hypothetical protein